MASLTPVIDIAIFREFQPFFSHKINQTDHCNLPPTPSTETMKLTKCRCLVPLISPVILGIERLSNRLRCLWVFTDWFQNPNFKYHIVKLTIHYSIFETKICTKICIKACAKNLQCHSKVVTNFISFKFLILEQMDLSKWKSNTLLEICLFEKKFPIRLFWIFSSQWS